MEEKKEMQVVGTREVLGKEFNFYGTWEQPMFLAKDVAERIEHSSITMMLQNIDAEDKVKIRPKQSLGLLTSNNEYWFLTEQGLYEVCMLSRKPIAKEMKREIKIILKEIRLTGGSVATGREEDFVKTYFPNFSDETKLAMVGDLQEQNKKLKTQLEQAVPIIDEYNIFMSHDDEEKTMSIVSKEIEVFGRNKLFEYLRNKGIFMSKHERWNVPYQKYIKQGYFKLKEKVNPDGETRPQTFVTPKGYSFLIKRLKEDGYLPDVNKEELLSKLAMLTEGGVPSVN